MNIVEILEISVQLRKKCALRDVSLEAVEGERVALFGESGSGKTTLLRVIAGLTPATSGSVRVFGRPPRSVREQIGVALDLGGGLSLLTPAQIIAKSLAAHDVPGYQRSGRAVEALELTGLYADRDVPLRELGGSARNRVVLAAALAPRPALMLLDNITATLTPFMKASVWRHIDDRRSADGLTVFHATGESGEAETADRVVLLDGGRVLVAGPPAQLVSQFASQTLTIEAADPDGVRRTLRGMFSAVLEEKPGGLKVSAPDVAPAVSHLFRHPVEGFRSVFIGRPTMWDVLAAARREKDGGHL